METPSQQKKTRYMFCEILELLFEMTWSMKLNIITRKNSIIKIQFVYTRISSTSTIFQCWYLVSINFVFHLPSQLNIAKTKLFKHTNVINTKWNDMIFWEVNLIYGLIKNDWSLVFFFIRMYYIYLYTIWLFVAISCKFSNVYSNGIWIYNWKREREKII